MGLDQCRPGARVAERTSRRTSRCLIVVPEDSVEAIFLEHVLEHMADWERLVDLENALWVL